ncbi:MAG: hypothetical protein IJZ80_10510, partial [Clostridia bacterium]|nr:hypothetical protein [Clostridia bacterium]
VHHVIFIITSLYKNPERDILVYPLSVSNPWSESIRWLECEEGGEQKKPAYLFENRQTSPLYAN